MSKVMLDEVAIMTETLYGPRRNPATGPADALVVLLHGLGADGADLIELAGPLGAVLPQAAFVAPDAPEPCDMAPYGRQWFSLQSREPAALAAGADRAAPVLAAFIEAELAARRLDASRLALVGFSQGTMMALHLGLRLDPAPAAIVGFSGLLVAPERLAAERHGTPPILLIHGTADDIVPFAMLDRAMAGLRAAGLAPASLACPGIGHGIDEAGLAAAATFLARCLGQG
ncbi:MAG TPA: PHB depolymerase family esterase [Aliidongia sp.]|nr:PHB depolymerase family esterase [Aliidongia sp.]